MIDASNTLWIGIEVGYSSEVRVRGNEVKGSPLDGVVLNHCVNCNVSDNNVHDSHGDGIYLKYCSNCFVTGNNITNCWGDGLWLVYSSNIHIYHNVFIDNLRQTSLVGSQSLSWNDSYPSGGNYWSDYNGEDKHSGPNQDQPGSDGFGDTPYHIDQDNLDYSPLMGPSRETLVQHDEITLHGETFPVQVVCNSTVLHFGATPGSVQTTLLGASGTTGYVEVVQPVGLNLTNIEVFLNNTKLTPPPYPEITTNGTHYFIYFTISFKSNWLVSIAFGVIGDVNFDGNVDIFDAVTLAAASGETEWDPLWNAKCDLNDDLIIDLFDCVLLAGHAGEAWPT
jgi:parallel beta-helix repeat protein